MKAAVQGDTEGSGQHQTVVLRQSGIDFHLFGDEGGWWEREGGGGSHVAKKERERGKESKTDAQQESKGLLSCQLDSLTPFGGEQTNQGISWTDNVDPSS